jgi:hypothetical protein
MKEFLFRMPDSILDMDTAGGQYLAMRSEFHTGVEASCSTIVVQRSFDGEEDVVNGEAGLGGTDGDPMMKVIWGEVSYLERVLLADEITGNLDGSVTSLTPLPTLTSEYGMDMSGTLGFGVSSERYKRLHLLEGRLMRGIMHVAGLNPKSYRSVSNPFQFVVCLIGVQCCCKYHCATSNLQRSFGRRTHLNIP